MIECAPDKKTEDITELIKISEKDGQQAVSARELHEFLGSKQRFTDWITNRIEKYRFIKNEDYEVFHKFMKNPSGGRPLDEYALTLDMAKELCMVENNDKGRQARRYFIEAEKRFNALKKEREDETLNSLENNMATTHDTISDENTDYQKTYSGMPSIMLMNGCQAVSALEMYIALGLSTSQWQRWYKRNITNSEFFTQDVDYQIFRHNVEKSHRGRPTQDFIISLDMAKHLAMMARTKRSHELRQYFIETEKKYQTGQYNTLKKEREDEIKTDRKHLLNAFATLEPDLEDYSNTILTLNFVTTRECFLKTILPVVKLYGGKYRGTPGYMFTQYEQAEEAQREINTKCFNYEIPIQSLNNTSIYALRELGLYDDYKKIFKLKEKLYA